MRQENKRQALHTLFGSAFILIVLFTNREAALTVLSLGLLFGIIVSHMLSRGVKLGAVEYVLKLVERKKEKHVPGKGAIMFFAGAIALLLLFREQTVVVGALFVAVYGDAASTIFGLKFGRHRIAGKKTIEGTLGGMLVSVLFLGMLFEWWVALLAAIAGMAAELIPLDDSISIPLVAAAVLTLLL